jgi:hypothetical protein
VRGAARNPAARTSSAHAIEALEQGIGAHAGPRCGRLGRRVDLSPLVSLSWAAWLPAAARFISGGPVSWSSAQLLIARETCAWVGFWRRFMQQPCASAAGRSKEKTCPRQSTRDGQRE